MKRKSSDLTEFYIQFLIVVYLLWSFPVLSFGQKEVLVPADGTVSEGEEQPVVALTFDDGPSGTSTPVLLEGLRKRGVRATFFVVGENVEKGENAQILREMSADGHLIGNHTYHHVNLSKMSAEQAQAELDATDELVRKITGKYPIYARAPYGEVPENGDVDRERFYIGWTVDPLDWMTEDVSRITQSVLEKVEPGDIILLHDSYLSSVQAALRIVDALQGKGYEFITVDQMISD